MNIINIRSLIIYQIRTLDGSFRFIATNKKELVSKEIQPGERLVGHEHIMQILGGNTKVIIGTT